MVSPSQNPRSFSDWRRAAHELVTDRLADARAHAEGGRLAAGHARLEELGSNLADILGDARAGFYYQAFEEQRPWLDPLMHRVEFVPSKEGERIARLAQIAGRDQAADLANLIGHARAGLGLTRAAHAHSDPDVRTAAYGTWEARHRSALQGFMRTSLSNAHVALREVIGRILVRPELQ